MERDRLNRREFMRIAAAGAGAAALPLAAACSARADQGGGLSDHEALAYEKLGGADVGCMLCPNQCIIPPGERGNCGVRENQEGKLVSLVYGRLCSAQVDPIEKKPLFHFRPGTKAFSIAAPGCNVECQFCQNWQISQVAPEDATTRHIPPEQIPDLARKGDCDSIAFTYSEPTVSFEYTLDVARAAEGTGVDCVSITNGYIQADPMKRLCEHLAAVKIDLKAFTEKFYRRYVRGRLQPVLDTIELLGELGMHTELVVLLIPGLNDGEEEIKQMSRWLVETVGPDVPMHFSRFHPAYKMTNLPRTPGRTVERACEIAQEQGVHYAYAGNMPGNKYESTYCHSCGKMLIERFGFRIVREQIAGGKCPDCGTQIPGVWG
ncbi:MAG: AmmeMemoRadiSam system radical SAM enzyme [Candidatus Brocadiia bacterium]